MSEVRFDNCLIEIDNVVYYALPTKLVDYVKKLYENNKSYQRQIERLGDKLAENTNYWVRTTDERNELQNQLQQKENIIKEVREYIENNDLYEQDYDYDYEENLVVGPPSDETARKILLGILDKVEE